MPTDALTSAITNARALEGRDEQAVAELETLVGLAGRVDTIRARAAAVAASFELVPRELDELAQRRAAADAEATKATSELERAELALARLEGARRPRREELDRARSEVTTAQAAVADAQAQIGRLVEREAALRAQHASLDAEAGGLVGDSAAITDEVDRIPRITSGSRRAAATSLEELDGWASQARSALFVARGLLEQERERIVQEANALGSAVLGEPLGGSSVALVRRRLEERI